MHGTSMSNLIVTLLMFVGIPVAITLICTFKFRRFETATFVATGITFLLYLTFLLRNGGGAGGWDLLIAISFGLMNSLVVCGFVALGIHQILAWKGPRYIFGHCMRCGNSLDGQTTGVCGKCGKAIGAMDHRCKKCDYDLMGVKSGICPECGERFEDDE